MELLLPLLIKTFIEYTNTILYNFIVGIIGFIIGIISK